MIGYNDHSYLSQSAPLMHRDINFKNFVNIENETDILNSNADYVIIYKNVLYEIIHMRGVCADFFSDTKRTEGALLKKLVKPGWPLQNTPPVATPKYSTQGLRF